ncbi:hypothetical protein [Mucilaginibacter sp. PAMB04168]|uniref:hypothetical protein n=1 Tax=Mucilaginibacter sp. PAMB04168 TaxID=3138567 RepID=UPI0031F6E9A7
MKTHIQEVLQLTQQHLETISQELVTDLNSVARGDYSLYKHHTPNDIYLIDIEIFADGYRPVVYLMDQDETQLGFKPLLASYPDGVLSGYDYDLDYDSYDLSDQEIDDFYEKQKDLFINWFIQCWAKVDNSGLTKPVYLMMHDDAESFDLRRNKWANDDEKWG